VGLKLSAFNIVVDVEGKPVLFNTRTHAILHGEMCERLLHDGAGGLLEVQKSRLRAKGILVRDEQPEMEALQVFFMQRKFFTNYVLLTVALTYRCNCACPDCPQLSYEDRTVMDEATRAAVAALLDHAIQVRRPTRCSFWLSGGEPFVRPGEALDLTRRIEEVCARRGVELARHVTTNGTLLGTSEARELSAHIDEFYVSLADSREAQLTQRPFANKRNSYDTVLDGLGVLAELGKKVTIRFNVTPEPGAADRVAETIADLYRALGNNAYPGLFFQFHVLVPRPSCAEGFHITPGVATDQLEQMLPALRELTGATPWPSGSFMPLPDAALMAKTPPLTPGQELRVCNYHKGHGFNISPTGDLWSCSMFAEQKRYWFAQLKDGAKVYENNRYLRFVNFDPFDDPRCKSCACLPICLRRCPIATYHETEPHRWSEDGCEEAVRARVARFLETQIHEETEP